MTRNVERWISKKKRAKALTKTANLLRVCPDSSELRRRRQTMSRWDEDESMRQVGSATLVLLLSMSGSYAQLQRSVPASALNKFKSNGIFFSIKAPPSLPIPFLIVLVVFSLCSTQRWRI